MRIAEFYKSLSTMGDKEYIEKFLLFNASLVIAGVKPGETITLKKTGNNSYNKWEKFGVSFLRENNLNFIELRESDDALIILVYNKEIMTKNIFNKLNKEFLMEMGYPKNGTLEEYLYKLVNRYEIFNCPHDLGIFLGIPVEDVKDFMECTNKKCLYCGYWKVYNNYDKAREVFNIYDKVKDEVVHRILDGDINYELKYNMFESVNINMII